LLVAEDGAANVGSACDQTVRLAAGFPAAFFMALPLAGVLGGDRVVPRLIGPSRRLGAPTSPSEANEEAAGGEA